MIFGDEKRLELLFPFSRGNRLPHNDGKLHPPISDCETQTGTVIPFEPSVHWMRSVFTP